MLLGTIWGCMGTIGNNLKKIWQNVWIDLSNACMGYMGPKKIT